MLGLFDKPYANPDEAERVCNCAAHRTLAYQVATKSLVLLKNDGMLPLDIKNVKTLAVIGPMARSAADLALELSVAAGPDPQAEGIGYSLALPPARYDRLADFRVLDGSEAGRDDPQPVRPRSDGRGDSAIRSVFQNLLYLSERGSR